MAAVSSAKNREVLDSGRRAVELARGAGVKIGFGTDLMGALEDEQLRDCVCRSRSTACFPPCGRRHR